MEYDQHSRPVTTHRLYDAGDVAGVSSMYSGGAYLNAAPVPSLAASSRLGIRVVIKPEYRISPPQLAPQIPEVQHCTFHFDSEFEKRILAEAENERHNWNKTIISENQSSTSTVSSFMSSLEDLVVDKHVSWQTGHEVASMGFLNYEHNSVKVSEFVNGYSLL